MTAIWYRARAQVRQGWLGLVALALLVAIAGGAVLASVGAARRTDSAFDRMAEANHLAEALVNPDWGLSSQLTVDELRGLPGVAAAGRVDFALVMPPAGENSLAALDSFPPLAIARDGFGSSLERPILDDGRFPDPAAPEELFVERWWAEEEGVGVGETIDIRALRGEEVAALFATEPESDEQFEELLAGFGTPYTLTIVGVGGRAESVAFDEGFEPLPWLSTEAYWQQFGQPSAGFWGAAVDLEDGVGVEELRRQLARLHPEEAFAVQSLEGTRTKVDRATRPQVVALWVFAALAAFVGLLVVGQALARRLAADASDNDALATLGMSRWDRLRTSMLRVVGVGVVGAALAVAVAAAVSPLSPIGAARLAEPDPGFAADLVVWVVGAGAIVLAVVLLGLRPAWRSAALARDRRSRRPSRLAAALGRSGAPVTATAGVRFALDPGSPADPVPARSTIAGATLAVAVVAAVVAFAASLDHLVTNPGLYGVPWDSVVEFSGPVDVGEGEDLGASVSAALAADARVEAFSALLVSEVTVDGRTVPSVAFVPGAPPIRPALLDGRVPGDDEVAMGASTMRTLGVEVGDSVRVGAAGEEVQVVGTVALPGVGTYQGADKAGLGEGMLFTPDALRRHGASFDTQVGSFVVEGDLSDSELTEIVESSGLPPAVTAVAATARKPSDIRALDRLASTPVVLGGLLTVLVAATVAHALVLAVRRRRHDLAVLRCVGLRPNQVLATTVWQAWTIAFIALVVGIPLGVVVGRWTWLLLARLLGVVEAATVPLPALVAVALVVVLLTGAVALGPGWWSSRRRPAVALRVE